MFSLMAIGDVLLNGWVPAAVPLASDEARKSGSQDSPLEDGFEPSVPPHGSCDFAIRRKETRACRGRENPGGSHGTASPFAAEPKVQIHFPPAANPVQTVHFSRDLATENVFTLHEANAPSGGRVTEIDIGTFLGGGPRNPEHRAL